MTLLLHVGLPKTGTSSLQRLLRDFDLTLGAGLPLRLPALGPPIWNLHFRVNAAGCRPIEDFPQLLRFLTEAVTDADRTVIFTDEGLTNTATFAKPPVDRISDLLDVLDPTRSNTRIACGIRPAVEWIPSRYAQSPSRGTTLAAQAQHWMDLSPTDSRSVLDFSHFDHVLSGLVGAENVTFLPLHEFGSPEYFQAFARGTTFDWRALHHAHEQNPARVNVRRDGERWQAAEIQRLRGRLAANHFPGTRMHRFLTSRWNLPLRAASALTWRPRPTVRLEDDVRVRILERFGPSARELAARRGLALDGHGYW